MITIARAPAAGPAETDPPRLLVVGGRKAATCRPIGQLEPRGYRIDRLAGLPLPTPLPACDVVIFALPAAEAAASGEACAQLRALGGPPMLVLHPGGDPHDAADMLDAGADDCLLAPHNPREVLARVRALIRRRDRSRHAPLRPRELADGCRLDGRRLVVRAPDGRQVGLTPLQHRLLTALMARPGEVVSREHLLTHVLGEDTDSFDRAIDVHVSRLKKRLAQVCEAPLITAYRGVGYRLDLSPAGAG